LDEFNESEKYVSTFFVGWFGAVGVAIQMRKEGPMGIPAEKIISEALQLPSTLRALVAERLIESLDFTDTEGTTYRLNGAMKLSGDAVKSTRKQLNLSPPKQFWHKPTPP
jgi:hypothetical protein